MNSILLKAKLAQVEEQNRKQPNGFKVSVAVKPPRFDTVRNQTPIS